MGLDGGDASAFVTECTRGMIGCANCAVRKCKSERIYVRDNDTLPPAPARCTVLLRCGCCAFTRASGSLSVSESLDQQGAEQEHSDAMLPDPARFA